MNGGSVLPGPNDGSPWIIGERKAIFFAKMQKKSGRSMKHASLLGGQEEPKSKKQKKMCFVEKRRKKDEKKHIERKTRNEQK